MSGRSRLPLVLGASAIVVAISTSANAQEAPGQAPAAQLPDQGDIVVTGSRLKSSAPVGSALLSVGRTDIEVSNATTTSQLLLDLPQVNNLGVSEATRSGNGGSSNFNFAQGLNIHGIGPYATLMLIDGLRVAPQGVTGLTADTSIIPTIALERVELVPDGASAIYGSDAIAGVANLILRRRLSGIEVNANYGRGHDFDQYQAGAIAGLDWGSGHGTIAYAYSGHSELRASDRNFARANLTLFGGSDFRARQCNPGNLTVGGVSYAIPAGGVTPAQAALLVPGTSNRCDNFAGSYLLPEIKRHNVVATVNQELVPDVSFVGTAFFARRAVTELAGIQTTTLTVPVTNAFYTAPPGSPVAPQTIGYAFTELPLTAFTEGVAKYYQASAGLRWQVSPSWRASTDFTYAGSDEISRSEHLVNSAALRTALASSNPATAFNPYGGTNTPAVLTAIGNGLTTYKGKATQYVADAAASGTLFTLPGGEVQLALGYQYQSTRHRSASITGNTSAPFKSIADDYTRHVHSVYGELLLPLIGPENSFPGAQMLQVNVAGRYDHYSDAGSTTNPKVGIDWEPAKGIRVHGSYGTSFRAPPIYQSHSIGNTFVTSVSDPLLGGASVAALQIIGGNPNVKPETATTYSLGVDVKPAGVPGLAAQLSYFNVSYKDILAGLGNNAQILNQSYYANLGIITRNPTAAQVAAILAANPLVAGVVPSPVPVVIDARTRNLAALKASGLDFLLSYQWVTNKAGIFSFGASGTYFLKFDSTAAPGAPKVDLLDTILNPIDFRARGYAGWRNDALSARVTVNYTDGYRNNLVTPVQKVSSNTTIDLNIGFELNRNQLPFFSKLRIAFEGTNIFDKKPPFVNIAPSSVTEGGYDAASASPVGRILAVSITAAF